MQESKEVQFEGNEQESENMIAREFADNLAQYLHKIVRESGTSQERQEKLLVALGKLQPILSRVANEVDVRERFKRIAEFEDEEVFVASGIDALTPVIDFAKEHPEELEAIVRKNVLEQPGYIQLNELMAYEVEDDGTAYIHFAPARTLGFKIRSLVKDAMRNLAQEVSKNTSIQRITAVSSIVGEHPGLLKLLGFTIDAEKISDEEYGQYFPEETRQVGKASMSRDEFLERYLK